MPLPLHLQTGTPILLLLCCLCVSRDSSSGSTGVALAAAAAVAVAVAAAAHHFDLATYPSSQQNVVQNLHERMEMFLLLLFLLSHHGLLRLAFTALNISITTNSYVCACQMLATDKNNMTL
jgi:hypothetical protein